MATRTTSIVYDDLDGSTDEVGTYRFAFNGVRYEIDLSRPNFDRMAAAFQPFLAAARRLPKSTARKQTGHDSRTDRRTLNAHVRQWWATHWQEHNLPEPRTRGAIPPAVRDAYNGTHQSGAARTGRDTTTAAPVAGLTVTARRAGVSPPTT